MKQYVHTSIPILEFQKLVRKCIQEELQHLSLQDSDEAIIKTDEVCQMFQVSKVTLHQWRKQGLIPFYRIGSRIFFKKSELISAMQSVSKYGRK